MQRRIQILAPHTANQIAAGEVVERPASVIKECVENSIDAGATKISIHLTGGGSKRIVIQDNGSGIHKADLPLAVSRHATSKIESAQDLHDIRSLGFRGEALASIASVSHFILTSRAADADEAWQITVDEMAQCSSPILAAHPPGTTIEIRGLFYNTPARRKFLRSERTESAQSHEIIKRLILSHFDIAFQVTMDDKTIYQLPAITDPKQAIKRIEKVCGKQFAERSMHIECEAPGLKLTGWLGEPSLTRSQNDGQIFFLNGRVVRDKLINHAVRSVYQEVIYPGRYPLYVLYLTCDPREVDVNVHPTKHEVRFHDSRYIHDFLTSKLTPIVMQQPDASAPAPAPMMMKEPMRRMTPVDSSEAVTTIQTHEKIIMPSHYIDNRYAVVAMRSQLCILDAARLIEKVYQIKLNQAEHRQAQPLLIPERVQLSVDTVSRIKAAALSWQAYGIYLQVIDAQSVLVQQWPKGVPCIDLEACLQRLAANVDPVMALAAVAHAVSLAETDSRFWSMVWSVLTWQPGDEVGDAVTGLVRCLAPQDLAELIDVVSV